MALKKRAKRYAASLKNNKDVTVETLKILANSEQSGDKVGWLGNFTDMALKTCLRNLLAKWGYLSVEMQSVLTSDNEDYDSTDDRNKAINDIRPNNLNIEDTDFTDETTAATTESETPTPSGDGPGY